MFLKAFAPPFLALFLAFQDQTLATTAFDVVSVASLFKPIASHPSLSAGFDDFFDPRPLMPVLAKNLERVVPAHFGFEIHEDDDKYSIAIDVPGVKSEDMTIKLEENGQVLNLSGGRKIKKSDGTVSETKFVKRFTIGENVDVDKITASLSDGVLEVTAPKKAVEKKEAHIIKITEVPPATSTISELLL